MWAELGLSGFHVCLQVRCKHAADCSVCVCMRSCSCVCLCVLTGMHWCALLDYPVAHRIQFPLQFLLFVMAIMLIRLLKGECDSSNRIEPLRIVGARHRVRVPQERDSLEEETTSSTVPLFSTTSPITPSAPPLPGIPLSPIAPISLAPAHYNINTDNGGGGGTRRGSQEPKPRRQSLHYFNAGAQSPRSPGVGLPSSGATATSL